jgi:hypothetical protein
MSLCMMVLAYSGYASRWDVDISLPFRATLSMVEDLLLVLGNERYEHNGLTQMRKYRRSLRTKREYVSQRSSGRL